MRTRRTRRTRRSSRIRSSMTRSSIKGREALVKDEKH